MRRTSFVLAACSCALLLTACGSPADRAAERAIENASGGDADVDVQGGTTRVTTSEGTVTVGEQELPADWPTDVPAYPGSTIQAAGTVNGQGKGALFQTSDASADVVAYYKTQLAAGGWTMDTVAAMGSISVLSASKEGRTVAIQIAASEGQTIITVGLDEKTEE